jgi:glycosyltransferase involved in cell wall biosynthesis
MDFLKMRLLYLISEDHYFFSHRLGLALAAKKAGYEVAVATRCHHHENKIREAGLTLFPLYRLHRSSLSPFKQFLSLLELIKIYRTFRPHIVHGVALVPVILGTLAAWLTHRPKMVSALGGLGYVFTEGKNPFLRQVLRQGISYLLRWSFRFPQSQVILQNQSDLETLQEIAYLSVEQSHLIPGAGIDLKTHPLLPFPPHPPIRLAFVGRLLWDKGLGDLIQAVKILKGHSIPVELHVYGLPDVANPACIPLHQLHEWSTEGHMHWHGHTSNVVQVYEKSHIAVLPSYREGLPKSLLEAAACGRPIVTTRVPGCQEVIKEGVTGLLVPPRAPQELADTLRSLISQPDLWASMGKAGRHYVEEAFIQEIIYKKTIDIYDNFS